MCLFPLTLVFFLRCTLDTTSCATCCPNLRKSAKPVRWLCLLCLAGRACYHLADHVQVIATIVRRGTTIVTETVIAAMTGRRTGTLRDTSMFFQSSSAFVLILRDLLSGIVSGEGNVPVHRVGDTNCNVSYTLSCCLSSCSIYKILFVDYETYDVTCKILTEMRAYIP